MTGNVGLHSVDLRLGNFAAVVAVLVAEQMQYRSVLEAEPIRFGKKNKIKRSIQCH